MKRIALAACFLLIACAPQATELAPSNELVAYKTVTPSLTPTPNLIIIAETPLPSPAPTTYTVQSGDTLSQIAERFHISLDDLQAANPDISPSSLSVGTVLLIPGESDGPRSAPTPTPVPAPVTQTSCHPTIDRGMWCFALVRNDSSAIIENVSAQVALIDSDGTVIASQVGFMPLNILPPKAALPVYVFFMPDVPAKVSAQVQLLSAVSLAGDDTRYLRATIHNASAQINWDGHSAQLSGEVSLPAESSPAKIVWVAAVAYDKDGQVVGVKRWEGGEIPPGGTIQFNFMVASIGSAIEAVEFVVEARP